MIALGGFVALALVLLNLRFVPRLRPLAGPARRRVSALVPARDEERTIEACLLALLGEPLHEIVVLDDGSSDRTAQFVRAMQARRGPGPALRLIAGRALPAGWAGKPHACAQLAEAATGDALLFLDADVRLEPGAVRALEGASADLVTAVPRQLTGTFAERLIVPLLHVVYYALAPLFLVPRVRDARVVAANGQLLFVDRAAYARFGGHAHERVRSAVVEDQALCTAAKASGLRVLFADGFLLARCRMYASAREVRLGFAKNLYLGVGGTPLRLAGALAVVLAMLALPLVTLPGALSLLALRLLLAARFRQPVVSALLHPVGMLALVAIALESAVRAHAGRIEWRGRLYGLPAAVVPHAGAAGLAGAALPAAERPAAGIAGTLPPPSTPAREGPP